MPYFETEFRKGDSVQFKGESEAYIIVDDPTEQSEATCAGDGLERCTIMAASVVNDDAWKFKPTSRVSLGWIEKVEN